METGEAQGPVREVKVFKRLFIMALAVPVLFLTLDLILFLVRVRDAYSMVTVISCTVTGTVLVSILSWHQMGMLASQYKHSVQSRVILEDAMREKLETESQARAAAEEATQTRDNLLSVASHDLRNPLGTMYFAMQSLQRISRENADAKVGDTELTRLTEMSIRQIRHMLRLLDDLMNISQITAGRMSVEVEEVDVAGAVGEVLSRTYDTFVRAGCDVRVDVRGPVYAKADPSKLDQVLANVLSNACKYGQGHPVDVSLKGYGGRVRISVRDHGIGISADDQARIFDKFERAVHGKRFVGHGLGLWIVRNVLETMGGAVLVESRVGEGSTFHIDLNPS